MPWTGSTVVTTVSPKPRARDIVGESALESVTRPWLCPRLLCDPVQVAVPL